MKKYFVILKGQNGEPIPLVNEDEFGNDKLATYTLKSAANRAGRSNIFGEAYGFEVFTWEPAPF